MTPPDPTQRVGSADIAGLIRREIARGDLAPKDKLPAERALAKTYGVARGTVRDALVQLAHEGLVQVRAGSGTYVSDHLTNQANTTTLGEKKATARDIHEARFALEPTICRLAATHATGKDLEFANKQIELMAASNNDPGTFFAAEQALLTSLTESTGNQLLVLFMSQINELRKGKQRPTAQRMRVDPDTATIAQSCARYQRVLSSIRARDAKLAESQMKEQLNATRLT